MFCFTCNYVWNWNKIISAAEGVLKLFQNYFRDNKHVAKYSRAAINLWNDCEIISVKFPRAEIKLFQTNVDEGGNNYEIMLFHMQRQSTCERLLAAWCRRWWGFQCRRTDRQVLELTPQTWVSPATSQPSTPKNSYRRALYHRVTSLFTGRQHIRPIDRWNTTSYIN